MQIKVIQGNFCRDQRFPNSLIERTVGAFHRSVGGWRQAPAENSVSSVQIAHEALILIVEDESLIRMLAADVAAEQGYVVLEAGNSDEALMLLERQGGIDLVFTDIDMPGKCDGLALARRISHSWPSVRIVVTSGKVRPRAQDLPNGSIFLAKPYRPEELANAFALVLQ
ncbi:response regulator [Sphingobium sp. H39-3-25]|uniref:response regulator n=1 Tax=Sphingobium arseniciresistens TaxID=3030834 RepID=UPI0023B9BFE7|nr:response regulator [Sphingobium arseniciresistens]